MFWVFVQKKEVFTNRFSAENKYFVCTGCGCKVIAWWKWCKMCGFGGALANWLISMSPHCSKNPSMTGTAIRVGMGKKGKATCLLGPCATHLLESMSAHEAWWLPKISGIGICNAEPAWWSVSTCWELFSHVENCFLDLSIPSLFRHLSVRSLEHWSI